MSDKRCSLHRRLKEIEAQLTEMGRKDDRSRCICRLITQVLTWQNEWFEKEINRRCPAHGVRSLGKIVSIRFVRPDRTSPVNPEFDRLMKIYEERHPAPELDLVQFRKNLRKYYRAFVKTN